MNFLDLLFPKKCVGCNKIGTYFCSFCTQNILQADLICPFCQKPSIGGVIHPICKRKYGLDGLWSLGIYQDPLKKALQKLKYRHVEEIAQILVNIVIEYWSKYPPYLLDLIKKDYGKNWMIVPVPLHWTRQNWRGFNQANLLGQILSKKIGLGYSDYLKRIRLTKPQVKLKGDKRRINIHGAFALSHNFHPDNHRGKPITHNIILIDDVWTTGSTLKECCFVLKRGGVKKVWALTLAR